MAARTLGKIFGCISSAVARCRVSHPKQTTRRRPYGRPTASASHTRQGRFAVSPLTMGDAWYDVCPERPTVLDAENRRGAKQYRQHRHGPGLDERAETTRATEVGSLGLRR